MEAPLGLCDYRFMADSGRLTVRRASAAVGRESAMSILAALLDRSLRQIAEAAADVRYFDRETIRAAADVWDNNLFRLFWAASAARAGERERRALASLTWMARLGERRRGWMTEQAAIAGHELAPLLPPVEPEIPGRDSRGYVMTPMCQLTRQSVDDLVPDYDLTAATVRHLRVERAGARLIGFLQLVVLRRFSVDENLEARPALLDVWLEGVTDVAFDISNTRGAALEADADGVEVCLGADGRILATCGEYQLDDRSWHLSAAGRRADALTPPRTRESGRLHQPPAGKLGAEAHAAATLLLHAMWELRSVRYAARADRVPVRGLCRAFSGAGEAILAAGSQRSNRHREAAFRDLIRTWAHQGGPALARWFAATLTEAAGRPDIIEVPEAPEQTPPSLARDAVSDGAPPQAALVMAAWTATHSDYRKERPATAQLLLALPPRPDEDHLVPWRLRAVSCTEPDTFRLRAAAFQGPGQLTQTGKPPVACSLDLHHRALHVVAPDGWSASVS